MRPDISIIIVNYNSGELLFNCLSSINKELSINYEVIIVDNNSTDNSIALCNSYEGNEKFKFIHSKENLGFAKGCNVGADYSNGHILHFLNPDTQLQPGSDSDYRRVIDAPEKVYVTPLINRDGSFENAKMSIPMLRDIFWWNLAKKKARFWCKGASVIVSRENFEKVGRWCEDYFMYGEDTDLFYSFWQNGLQIEMLEVPVFHYGGGCSSNVWSNMERELIVQRSFRRFFKRHSNVLHYITVKLYYIMHNLFKHPAKVPFDIKAWWKFLMKG